MDQSRLKQLLSYDDGPAIERFATTGGEALKVSVQGVDYPKCFESIEQWQEWKKSAAVCKQACNICNDCTYAYQHEMTLQGRCDRKTFWGYIAKPRKAANEG